MKTARRKTEWRYDPAAMRAITAVVLPGLDGTGDLLTGFVAVAPAYLECRTVRYPTHEVLGYDQLEVHAAAQLPSDGTLLLIAESFSGPVAVRLAERFGNRVARLVVCNSFVTPPRSPLLRYCARSAVFRLRLPERILAALMLAPFATPTITSSLATTLQTVDPAVLASRLRQLLTVNELDTLARVTAQITYLRGTLDRLVPERAVAQIVRAVPTVRVHRIRAPHALLQTNPKEAWEAIEASVPAAD